MEPESNVFTPPITAILIRSIGPDSTGDDPALCIVY